MKTVGAACGLYSVVAAARDDDDYDDDDDEKTFHKISCTKRQNQIPIIGSRVGIFVQTDERTGRHNRRTARLQT